jgi:cytochrome oxidase Cu insertion factor (SCO1/SenC/PrrC family)
MPSVTTGRSYLPLVLLVLLFGLPPAAGWLYIMNPQWLPEKQKNHGTLVSPPRPLQSLRLEDDRRQPFDWDTLSGQWILISRNSGACDDGCRQQLQALRQIRRALGAERLRVERLLIQESPTADRSMGQANGLAEGAQVLYLPADQQAQFDRLFAVSGTAHDNAIYLADPRGMLMMGYSASSPKKDILKDLETLLKASRNWTTGVNNGHG